MIIITRHPAFVEYLIEQGIADPDVPVIEHAEPSQIKGQHVVGMLPLHLAALADQVTTVPLDLPAELRGEELSLDQVRAHAGQPRHYSVREHAGA